MRDPVRLSERVEAQVVDAIRRYSVPGVSVALCDPSGITSQRSFGVEDVVGRDQVALDSAFNVASVSKPVTAWGVLRLVEHGDIELDAPLHQYASRWRLPGHVFDPSGVTVRRVLNHTAGLPSGAPSRPTPEELNALTLEESLSDKGDLQSVRVVHEPGTRFLYSNAGYALLQLLIEEVTGQKFADYMRESVLEPLGMTRSSFDPLQLMDGALAHPHASTIRRLEWERTPWLGAGGLYTTAGDLTRFAWAHTFGADGSPPGRGVIGEDALQVMLTPDPVRRASLDRGRYALGYNVFSVGGTQIVGHAGLSRGFAGLLLVQPESGQGLGAVANSNSAAFLFAELASQWVNEVTGSRLPIDRLLRAVRFATSAAAVATITFSVARGIQRINGHQKRPRRGSTVAAGIEATLAAAILPAFRTDRFFRSIGVEGVSTSQLLFPNREWLGLAASSALAFDSLGRLLRNR